MNKTNPEDLLAAGVHFGHKQWRIHPKSKRFIYKIERKASIIDLFKTAEELDRARQFVYDLAKAGKILLVVATKKQAKEEVATLAVQYGVPYLTNKWIGGFLTNFEEVSKNIKKMQQFKKDETEGAWTDLPKHEIVKMRKDLVRVERIYKGVDSLTKAPDCLFIIDIKKENSAVLEAKRLNTPTVAIADTNSDPTLVDYPIPGNDDAVTSIHYLANAILESYAKGRADIVEIKETK